MSIGSSLMRTVSRMGSRIVFGSSSQAEWIYEKIQEPRSYYLVARNLLNWKLHRPQVRGIVGLMVEAVFDCNLRCSYCYRTSLASSLQKRPRIIEWDVFRTVVDKTPASVETIQLCGMGEPTMHPQLCEMVEYIAQHGKRPSVFTNGTLLKGEFLERLARSPLAVLNVSVEPDEKTCREFRGIDLETIRQNIRNFMAVKRPETDLKVRMVAHPGNHELLTEAVRDWEREVQGVKVGPLIKMKEGNRSDFTCIEPWRSLFFVYTDGKVSPCAMDMFKDMVIGDLTEQTFEEIIQGQPYRDLLTRFAHGEPPGLCATCSEVRVGGVSSLFPRLRRKQKH